MASRVGIIVLNWNGKKDTAQCLDSLRKIESADVEIVVVDNGSSDDSVSYFRESFPECTMIETGYNLGYSGGNNVGISYGLKQGFDYFFILNNDTVVDPEVVKGFLSGFERDPKVGILGGKIYLMADPTRLDHFGGTWNPKRLDFDYVGHRAQDQGWDVPLELDYVCGAAIMVKRAVFEKVGLFDPRFFLFWEETDFCFHARRAGFSVMTCPEAKVWHKVSASFTGGKPHAAYFFWRNRLLWIERNFKGIKRAYYLSKLIGKSFGSFYSLKGIRSLQQLLQKAVGKDISRNQERLIRYDAALCGIKDYLLRRFGEGRSKKFMNCH